MNKTLLREWTVTGNNSVFTVKAVEGVPGSTWTLTIINDHSYGPLPTLVVNRDTAAAIIQVLSEAMVTTPTDANYQGVLGGRR